MSNSQNELSERHETMYSTEIECEVCSEHFEATFHDPMSPFSATCPNCNTHYPELNV